MANMLIVRFRAYEPNGPVKGVLPHPLSWEAGLPLNDMSSLTMTYPDGTPASELLKGPCEVALEIRNPNTGVFTEYPGCRFLNLRWSQDLATRPRIISFTMPSYGWMMKKARWMNPDNPFLTAEKKIVFNGSWHPGHALQSLFIYCQQRGVVPGLFWSFGSSFDSTGASWTQTINNMTFDYGQDAWSVLDAFARQGYFDWWMEGRSIHLYKPNTFLRRVLSTNTGVHVHSMLGNAEEQAERTWEDQAGHILALGDNNSSYLFTAPDIDYYPWGKWDDIVQAGGVSDQATLQSLATAMHGTKFKSRAQFVKRFVWTEGAPIPLAEYRQGDVIRARDDTESQLANMRIHQITLSGTDPYGVSIALTLNDRFTDRALQNERWIARLSGSGGAGAGGGTGGTNL